MSTLGTSGLGSAGNILSALQQSGAGTSKPLGKDDFLKLLVTQLQNQDPTQPQDPTQQIAQLAQFSSLEQMKNINSSFTSLLQLSGLTQSASLIGKNVTASDANGNAVSGVVTSVKMDNGNANLLINGKEYPLSSVSSVG